MKNLRSYPLGRAGCIYSLVNASLAVALTLVSLLYVRPKDCNRLCNEPEGVACPSGACRFNEQRAGWPLPVLVDYPGGGSPTSGWGILGPEDIPLPHTFILDVLFYSLLLWLATYIRQVIRGHTVRAAATALLPLRLIAIALPLTAVLAALLWLIYMYVAYTILRIG